MQIPMETFGVADAIHGHKKRLMKTFNKPILRITFVLLLGGCFISCDYSKENHGTISVGEVRLAVPARYRTHPGNTVPGGALGSLDQTHDALLVIPFNDLGMSPDANASSRRTDAFVYLIANTDSLVIPRDAVDAWRLSGEYEGGIVEAESEGGFFRVYSQHAYPSVWYVFQGQPQDLGEQVNLADRWVADCRGASGTERTPLIEAECLTYFRWRSLLVQVSFPGFLLPKRSQLTERIEALIEDWTVD
jgi:hypothetical protein